jgi:hypothetical protein
MALQVYITSLKRLDIFKGYYTEVHRKCSFKTMPTCISTSNVSTPIPGHGMEYCGKFSLN